MQEIDDNDPAWISTEISDWAESIVWKHKDIVHIRIIATDSKGHKHDYMHGDAGSAGLTKADIAGLRDVLGRALNGDFAEPKSIHQGVTKISYDGRGGFLNLGQDFTGQYRDGEPER